MNKNILIDAFILIVLFMPSSKLFAADIPVNRPTKQKSSIEMKCEQPEQLIPMLMGHTNLAQFTLLGIRFPDETSNAAKKERIIQIEGGQPPLKLNLLSFFKHGELSCGDIHGGYALSGMGDALHKPMTQKVFLIKLI